MQRKQTKIICIILAGVLAFSAVTGYIVFYIANLDNDNFFSMLKVDVNQNNYVSFKSDVHIADNPTEIQENFISVDVKGNEYTLVYKNKLPDFFGQIKKGEFFCVYPDDQSSDSFFALGFCGEIISVEEKNDNYRVSFATPKLTDVFSNIYINTQTAGDESVVSGAFYANENVLGIQAASLGVTQINAHKDLLSTASKAKKEEDSLTLGNTTVGYKFKGTTKKSLLDDYVLLCDKLKLNIKQKSSQDETFAIEGTVTLEEMATKMLLDYHYDESTDTVIVKDYSLGFIAKQKVDLKMTAEKSVALDDINVDLSEKAKIIDIEDVTESEEGKIVLGTYLIGVEAALPVGKKSKPILQNDVNDVSYLSLGIAVQFCITTSGELSFEYSVEESGFTQIEVNGNGDNICLTKGYDYPNPVTEGRTPTLQEEKSCPTVTSEISGKANLNVSFGGDIGLCILGMIPVKMSNNFFEFDITKKFSQKEDEEKATEVIKNNYLLDDNVDSLTISTSSYLKMHLGAKIDFGKLKYTVAETGGSIQLFKEVWFQSPPAVGFSHSQCGFGGIFLGEKYSDDELNSTFKEYMKGTDKDSILLSASDSLFGSIINAAVNDLQIDLLGLASYIGADLEKYKTNYFSAGVIYVRDENDIVVATVVVSDRITNDIGVHNGLSNKKIEQVYSAPDFSAGVEINIGSLVKNIFGIDGIENKNILGSTYFSCDSNDKMDLVFSDQKLVLIVLTVN